MRTPRSSGSPIDECPGFTLVELLLVVVVLGVLAAVVIFSLGGVSASATAASCRADAHIVETAVRAYVTQNGAAPTTADLTASTNPYLAPFPTSPSFTITLDHGVVEVAAPSGSSPVPASSPRACAGLAARAGATTTSSPGSTTTTSTTSTTTTTAPASPITFVASTAAGNTSRDSLTLTFRAPVTSWTVRITVDASAGETYKGQSRPYARSWGVASHTIVYTWSDQPRTPVPAGSRITLSAWFGWRGGHHTHDFAGDGYAWTAVSGGVTTSGQGGL